MTPSGRETERYRTTGNDWRSETVQERTQTLTQSTAAQRLGGLTFTHMPIGNSSSSHTPDRDLLFIWTAGGSKRSEYACVCVCVNKI